MIGLLAAVALGSTSSVGPGTAAGPSEPVLPDVLRRALAFIDANAHRDISAVDVARAAHVTVRTLQLAFRRHLDMTPTSYLRRLRLDGARRELAAAAPGSATVTGIAARWGFPSHSRFTVYYREAFGETPSTTLRRPSDG